MGAKPKRSKVPFTFRLQAVEAMPDGKIEPHFVLIGPRDEFVCYGPIAAYELMERMLKLAGLATRQNSLADLQREGIMPQPELDLPQLPPALDKSGGRFIVIEGVQ